MAVVVEKVTGRLQMFWMEMDRDDGWLAGAVRVAEGEDRLRVSWGNSQVAWMWAPEASVAAVLQLVQNQLA